MTLIRRNQSQPVFTNFFDDFLNKEWSDWGLKNYSRTNTTIPSVNISENDENFLIEVAAPGLDKSDFSIEVNQGTLKISSEIKSENQDKEERYTRREFSYQSFCRSFSLPLTVDSDKIEQTKANIKISIEQVGGEVSKIVFIEKIESEACGAKKNS